MNDKDFSEVLSALPLDLQREIVENNHRKNYGLLEEAELQETLRKQLQSEFTRGRRPQITGSKNTQKSNTLSSFGIERVDELIGKMTDCSKETVRKNRVIHDAVQKKPELGKLVDKVDQGKASYTMLYKIAKRKSKPSPKPLPDGKFDVIYADPPWQYRLSQSGAAEDHYPTMPTEEICKMGSELPVARDVVLFLWATIPRLEDAFEVIKAWGFVYKSALVWEKEKNGQIQKNGIGYWVNSAAELLLIAVKGNPGLPAVKPLGVVRSPRTKHSEKPQVFYNVIENAFPDRKYLELFARSPEPKTYWTFWGNEADSKNNKQSKSKT